MARVTIEDCLNYVDNSYELVTLAARRARQIVKGGRPLVATEEGERQEKAAVIALREIAENRIHPTTDFVALEAEQQAEMQQEDQETLLTEQEQEAHKPAENA